MKTSCFYVPSASAFDYSTDSCVAISVSNAKYEIIADRLRLYPFVLIVDGLVTFLYEYNLPQKNEKL